MESLQQLTAPSLVDFLGGIRYISPPPIVSKKSHKKKQVAQVPDATEKKKRNRITFDVIQVEEMEKVFAENQYPDALCRDELATRIQLHEERVQIWFQNRRAKYRRELRHTYHPYEPPKEIEYPFLKKKSPTVAFEISTELLSEDRKAQNSSDQDGKIKISNEKLETSPGSRNSSDVSLESLVDLIDESSDSNAIQLATSLNLFLNANQSSATDLSLKTMKESTMVSDKEQDASEQLTPDKANLLMWALSSLFNVRDE
ncbi:unnamed protein product [Caenorhabditis sp. 36 PRJEB53466]|nr:unnamed protein product [Caenorhabditis sp. 36 PRJEB53466]